MAQNVLNLSLIGHTLRNTKFFPLSNRRYCFKAPSTLFSNKRHRSSLHQHSLSYASMGLN